MFKNKSKKLIFRILLLMLVDAMIITSWWTSSIGRRKLLA